MRMGYFATGAVVASFLTLVFLLAFFVWCLVLTAGFASVVAVLPAAGGLAWLAAWLAANMGMEATAKAIAIKLFFIFFFLPCGPLPAHKSIMRRRPLKHDSPGRLSSTPNRGL
jgi:hypothetical protein